MRFDSRMQVLMTGCYRSGTEYVALMLGNHPDLAVSMYVVNYMRFGKDRYGPVSDPDNYTRLVFDAAQRIRIRWDLRLDAHAICDYLRGLPEVTDASLYDAMMSSLFLENGTQAWAEKNQLLWTKIPAFLDMFPAGKAVHIIRDPRSVLASFKKYTYAPPPAYLGAVFNCLGSMRAAQEYTQVFSSSRYCLVRFEDFLADPRGQMVRLTDFLGLDFHEALLSEEGWRDAHGDRWTHNSVFVPEGQAFDRNRALRRWEGNLTEQELALCEYVNRDVMLDHGYGEVDERSLPAGAVKALLQDDVLTGYLRRFLDTGQGVECFPTDPLDPANWEESRERPCADTGDSVSKASSSG